MVDPSLSVTPSSQKSTAHSSSLNLPAGRIYPSPNTPVKVFGRRCYLPVQEGQIWIIKNGVVRSLTYREDGTIVTLGIWTDGDAVGSKFSGTNPYLVETLTPVEVVKTYSTEWLPSAEQLLNYVHQIETLMLLRANRRVDIALLSVLKWLAERFGHQLEKGCLIDLKVTHQDLADLTGATRVTITRLLKQFEMDGLIYRKSRQLILSEVGEHWHYEI